MSAIAEVRIPADAFELGRFLEMDAGTTITAGTRSSERATSTRRSRRFDWDVSDDSVLAGIRDNDAQILEARGTAGTWAFELRFDTHAGLSRFREHCSSRGVPLEVGAVYNPTRP